MTHKLSKAGAALLAALVLGALGASAAQGSVFYTKENKYPVSVTGTQLAEQVMKLDVEVGKNSEVKCTTLSETGTLAATSSTLTLQPTYGGCTAFGEAATINATGCNYVIHSKEFQATDEYLASTDLSCGGGGFINLLTAACEVHITPQNGMTWFKLTDSTAVGHVLFSALNNAFSYTVVKDGAQCALTAPETRIDGTFNASGVRLSAKFGGVAWPLIVE